jgi:hypothetical protein
VLVNREKIDQGELRELITDSWLIKAPAKLRRQFESQ